MKTFPCGCTLTRESWSLCRAHYDAKEGRLDAYFQELQRLELLRLDIEGELACACDLLNTWCRESSVKECSDPYRNLNLRETIDRLWSKLSIKATYESSLAAGEQTDG